jgi:DUF3017 family protein
MSSPADSHAPLYQRRPLVAGLVRQWPLFLVIVAVGIGLGLVAVEQWRRGLVVIGLALIGAALMRLLMPLPRVGFLAVRSRALDVALTGGTGAAIAIITLAIPHA